MSARRAWLWLLFALAVRVATLPFIDGTIWPDETYQMLEPGSALATGGHGLLPWEWDEGIRSWLVPGLYGALFRVADLVGVDRVDVVQVVAWVLNCLLSLAVVAGTIRLVARFAGARAADLGAFVAAVAAPLVFYAPHPLGDCGATALVVLAYARWLERARGAPAYDVGLLLGAAFAFRYSIPVFFVAPVLVALFRRDGRGLATCAAGFGAVALALGLVDLATWGAPFASLVGWFRFNVLEGGAHMFGVAPAGWYFGNLAAQLGVCWPLVAVLALRGAWAAPVVGAGAALGFALVSASAHKEERFILPFVALLPALATLGAWHLGRLVRAPRWRLGLVALALAATSASSWAAYAEREWRPRHGWFDAMRWIGGRADVRGVLVARGFVWIGGVSQHRMTVPVLALDELLRDPQAARAFDNRLFNYLVVDDASLPALRDTVRFPRAREFKRVRTIDGVSVLQRR